MIEIIKAFLIGAGVAIVVGLFRDGYTGWATFITSIAFIYIFDKLNARNRTTKKLSAYRIKLNVCPNWEEIIPITPKEGIIKTGRIIHRILEDPELEIDKDSSLYGKEFSFIIFTDEATGVTQIWSNQYKTFVDEFEIYGAVISGNTERLQQKYNVKEEDLNSRRLIINPWEIGYAHESLPEVSIDRDKILSQIPFGLIIEHLTNLHVVWGNAMKGILKFPKELQEEFDKYGVNYETWDNQDWGAGIEFEGKPLESKYAKHVKKAGFEISDDVMRSHGFSTKHYTIYINIEFFDRGN